MKLPTGLAAGGGGVFLLAVFIGWYGMPKMIHSQIASNLALKKGSEIRQMWSNFSDAIEFRVYMMNVTNPEAVHAGAKPIIQEVGPYFYEEYKQKVKLQDHREDDTVSYNNKVTWLFNRGRSAPGLTGDELITMPHPLMLGLILALERDKPGMLGLLNKALPHVFRNPPHVFVTAPVKNFLFEGVLINCTVTDFSAKAVCTGIKKEAKDLKRAGDNLYLFSFFGHKNATVDPGRLRVKRGLEDIDSLGRVVSFNGESKLSSWAGDPCNDIQGTDSTIFPPFRDAKEPIVAFAPDLCLSLGATWERPTEYLGVPGNRYVAEMPDMKGNPEHHCYCPTEKTCMEKGALDLSPCAGAPIVATLPHFYLSSDIYQRSVDGLNPTKEKHEIFLVFETLTGSPMEARKRLQFNMFLHKVTKIDLMANMPTALVPLIWVEEGLALEEKYISTLRTLYLMQKVVSGVKWTLMLVGAGMAGAGGYLYAKRRKELMVGPAEPAKVPGNHNNNNNHLPVRLDNGSADSRY